MEKLEINQLKVHKNKDLNSLDGEAWKDVSFNNKYSVSNFGRIKSKENIVNHNYGGKAIKKSKILSQCLGSNRISYVIYHVTKSTETM